MNYAVLLSLLGLAQAGLGISVGGAAGLLVGWSGISFLAVGLAYADRRIGPRIFGKQPEGHVRWANTLLLLPYLTLTYLLSWVHSRSRRGTKNEIIEGLFLGQRLTSTSDLPKNTVLVVDLTGEMPEPREIRSGRRYLSVPTLDTRAPEDKQLREIMQVIMEERERKQGTIYVHCALGHGRSAMVVSAVLITLGLADSAEVAEAMVRRCRRGIRLSIPQKTALERYQRNLVV